MKKTDIEVISFNATEDDNDIIEWLVSKLDSDTKWYVKRVYLSHKDLEDYNVDIAVFVYSKSPFSESQAEKLATEHVADIVGIEI